MFEASRSSLLVATKLLSENFTEEERRFAGNIAFKLRGRISARREIAGSGGDELGMNANPKLKIGVSIGSTVINKVIPTALKWILPGIAGAAMFIAGASIGVASVVVGVIGLIVFGVTYLLETRSKNKIKGRADIYKDYFPKDDNTVKLLAQLVTLSMHKELQVSALQQAAQKYTPWQRIKHGLQYIVRVITAKKTAPTKEQERIRTLVKSEFGKLWDIFKNFTRNPNDYTSFQKNALAKEIMGLFERHFDLGDPNDRSEIVNDRDINRLWIHVFARYLKEQKLEVRALTMRGLKSKLNTLAVPQPTANVVSPLQEANDTTLSFKARRASLPSFFSPKPAALVVAPSVPEPSLVLSTRL
ncbi:hypothetical protein RVIR1_06730 [Candidatus Rickettsiella viridis]|uniref:Uncharacterized protein n=1 Tax=Candidatus Rickettsiella viridis TaxID=676208 RepID=A0A2Z5UW92_9COXI|nr:hypothetical protein [Candidatus Rickettsiella viridis]BBB15170.1 hypothetical protein RVIR1_06730 [Candidatus Rickettsiella viridis]